MSYKWTSERKWARLMSFIKWKEIPNWDIINQKKLLENIPLVEDWVRRNLRFVTDNEVFYKFYWPSDSTYTFVPNDYTRKTRCEHALAALYAKEIAERVGRN